MTMHTDLWRVRRCDRAPRAVFLLPVVIALMSVSASAPASVPVPISPRTAGPSMWTNW